MAKASARPRLAWEQLPDSSQRIYLALAEGDQQRAQQLHEHDQRPRGRRRRIGDAVAAAAAGPPTRDARDPRESDHVFKIVAARITLPPTSDHTPGRSPFTRSAQIGFRAGSTSRSTDASKAGTCRVAFVMKT